jgi:hypothetical protein
MADYRLWRTLGRVVKKPGQIVLILATVAAVPLTWLHVLAHRWESVVLTIVVILFLSTLWELHQETKARPVTIPESEMAKIPDFTQEFMAANEMLGRPHGSREQTDLWVENVYAKLVKWNISAAETFRPVKIPETPESRERRQKWFSEHTPQLLSEHKKEIVEMAARIENSPPRAMHDPNLESLKRFRDRLLEIVNQ